MIQIKLNEEKQKQCEEIFLQSMGSILPFELSEIYGDTEERPFAGEKKSRKTGKKSGKEEEKQKEIEEVRGIIWEYPRLYRFLYLESESAAYPGKEDAVKKSVYKDRLRHLLTGRPSLMTEGKRRLCLAQIIEEIGEIENDSNKLLKKVFLYDNFSNSIRARKILKLLDIKVCPYCNRAFVATIEEREINTGWRGTRPQFDHYFPKQQYPYLAVNFYNLIPSCGNCNQFKSKTDTFKEPVLYPYDEGMGREYVFSAYPDKGGDISFYDTLRSSEKMDLCIEPNPKIIYKNKHLSGEERQKLEERVNCSVRKLHLKELYNTHQDYAANVIINGHLFGDAYIRMLNHCFPEMEFTVQDVKKILYGRELDEGHWGQEILSKLTYDLDAEICR